MDVGTCPHQVLAATLTLSQPGGTDYAHPILGSLAGQNSPWRPCIRVAGIYNLKFSDFKDCYNVKQAGKLLPGIYQLQIDSETKVETRLM